MSEAFLSASSHVRAATVFLEDMRLQLQHPQQPQRPHRARVHARQIERCDRDQVDKALEAEDEAQPALGGNQSQQVLERAGRRLAVAIGRCDWPSTRYCTDCRASVC